MLHGSQRVVNEELRIALGSRDLIRPRSSEILLVQQLRKRPQTIKDISSIHSDSQENYTSGAKNIALQLLISNPFSNLSYNYLKYFCITRHYLETNYIPDQTG